MRIPMKLLRQVDSFVESNEEGYMNRSQVGTDAFRTFLAWKQEQRARREVWDAWVKGGKKGTPPEAPGTVFGQPWGRRDKPQE